MCSFWLMRITFLARIYEQVMITKLLMCFIRFSPAADALEPVWVPYMDIIPPLKYISNALRYVVVVLVQS